MKHVNVVCAIITNDEGLIYAVKRGPGRVLEGFYEFPGGKIEASETKEETIIREIKEELKSDIMPIRYIGHNYYEYEHVDSPFEPFSIDLYAYECKLIKGSLELTEHTDYKWCTKEELKKLNFCGADAPIIELI